MEYYPPISQCRFATLNVVFPQPITLNEIPTIMEAEVRAWIERYPVPVMAFAFDARGDVQDISPERPCDSVIGFKDKLTGQICLNWELLPDDRIPYDALNVQWLKKVYCDIPLQAQPDLHHSVKALATQVRISKLIVLCWVAVLPAAWAVLEYAGPQWLGAVVMSYAIGKAATKALTITGRRKKSPREIEEEELEQRKRHYFYHCEKNPQGFARLKAENFEREDREEIQKEAISLGATHT